MTVTSTALRWCAAALAPLAGVLLAGCGSSDAPADGWQRIEMGALVVEIPESWVETGHVTEQWTNSWQDAEGEGATVQLLANPDLGYYDAVTARGIAMTGAQVGGLPGYQVTGQEDPEPDSDREIARTDFTYETDDGAYEGVLWAASDPDSGRAVLVQITSEEIDADLAEHISSSIRVVDPDA